MTSTWKNLIEEEMIDKGDTWENVVSCTLTDDELNNEFDEGYGCSQGEAFTLWTETRVYFPLVYDGAEWVGSVSRFPDGIPTEHFGAQ